MAQQISTARKIGRVVKTIVKAALALVLSAAMVGVNVILPRMGMISRMANDMLGYQQSWTTPAGAKDLDADYYKSDFTADELEAAEDALDYAIASEGFVLLKNDDATMPFEQGTTFSFFSENVKNLTATQSIMTMFTGASGDQDKLTASFEAKGLHVNPTLMEFYTKGAGSAYTMGVGSIMESKKIVLLAFGKNKAAAVAGAVEGGISQFCTASALQMHPDVWFFCDEEAASKLKLKKYYAWRAENELARA